MPAESPPLDATAVLEVLAGHAARFSLQLLDSCPSTNAALLARPPADDGRVHVLCCEHQTAGRGRRGRSWHAVPGEDLTFSALWRFPAGAPVPAGLSLVAGLAVARVLEDLGVDAVQLKWPNDVMALGRKLAGILVELTSGPGRAVAAVIGIGINLRRPRHSLLHGLPAAGLDELLAPLPSRERLLGLLLLELERLLSSYQSAGFAAFRGAWEQRNAYAGLPVRISGEGAEIAGTCLGVDDEGALRLRTDEGERRVLAGDVSLRPAT